MWQIEKKCVNVCINNTHPGFVPSGKTVNVLLDKDEYYPKKQIVIYGKYEKYNSNQRITTVLTEINDEKNNIWRD